MGLLDRLKELEAGYRASSGVYYALQAIFDRDEIDEVFNALPKLLAVVEIANLMVGASTPEAHTAYGIRLVKALAALDEVPG